MKDRKGSSSPIKEWNFSLQVREHSKRSHCQKPQKLRAKTGTLWVMRTSSSEEILEQDISCFQSLCQAIYEWICILVGKWLDRASFGSSASPWVGQQAPIKRSSAARQLSSCSSSSDWLWRTWWVWFFSSTLFSDPRMLTLCWRQQVWWVQSYDHGYKAT